MNVCHGLLLSGMTNYHIGLSGTMGPHLNVWPYHIVGSGESAELSLSADPNGIGRDRSRAFVDDHPFRMSWWCSECVPKWLIYSTTSADLLPTSKKVADLHT